jgi:hypothetical protein
MSSAPRLVALALLLLVIFASPASAGQGGSALLAAGYWQGFIEFWQGLFQRQSGVVMGVIGVGIVALIIITRGKWNK